MSGLWREPDEESTDLYPGLVVHDGRQAGSITVGQSRLPLWCAPHYLARGWTDFAREYGPDDDEEAIYGVTLSDIAAFMHNLFEMRGEFGRLLLVLANAERVEGDRSDEHFAKHAAGKAIIEMDIGDGGCPFPPSWWEMPDVRATVRAQLVACIGALDHYSEGDAS